jgi:hypothetical protein
MKVFSQNGEDGVICEILRRIGAGSRYFIEFGIQSGREGNCVFLADALGWSGHFIESDPDSFARLSRKYEGSTVTTTQALVTPDNADRLFFDAGSPTEPDVLSIDIDGNDIWVWNGIRKLRPRLVIIEYNSSLDRSTPMCQTFAPDAGWNETAGFGSSLAALDVLAGVKGYTLVHTDLTGVNAFYVRDDLVAAGFESSPRHAPNYELEGRVHEPGEPPNGWTMVDVTSFGSDVAS